MKLLATEKFNSQETPLDFIKAGIEVDEFNQWLPDDTTPLLVQMERSNPDFLFVGLQHQFTAEILEKAPNLKIIATRTTGLDHIDLEYCKAKEIRVLSLREEREFLDTITATAEWTFINMGMLLRRTRHELKGKTIGLIGSKGRLATMMKKYAIAFQMNVFGYDKDDPIDTLHELLNQSDIVSLHITADEENRNFMDRTKFDLMKDDSWFLNSSRGWLVDNEALKWALDNKLAGAWLDFPIEFEHQNLIITNHQGGKTFESLLATEFFMADILLSHIGIIKKLKSR